MLWHQQRPLLHPSIRLPNQPGHGAQMHACSSRRELICLTATAILLRRAGNDITMGPIWPRQIKPQRHRPKNETLHGRRHQPLTNQQPLLGWPILGSPAFPLQIRQDRLPQSPSKKYGVRRGPPPACRVTVSQKKHGRTRRSHPDGCPS